LAKQVKLSVENVRKIVDFVVKSLNTSLSQKSDQENKGQFVRLTELLLEELRKFFRPELLNRFDEIIVFKPLSPQHMLKIVNLQLNLLAKLLQDQRLGFQFTPKAVERLASLGFDPIYGARPLRRTIQRRIENPISTLIIKGEAKAGNIIVVDFTADEFTFTVKGIQPVSPTSPNTNVPSSPNQPDHQAELKSNDQVIPKTTEISPNQTTEVKAEATETAPPKGEPKNLTNNNRASPTPASPLTRYFTKPKTQTDSPSLPQEGTSTNTR
jgi:hypothetical protein